jgi:hypothetical protein
VTRLAVGQAPRPHNLEAGRPETRVGGLAIVWPGVRSWRP